MTGLARAGLIIHGAWGPASLLNGTKLPRWRPFVEPGGFTFSPTEFGIDYWLWAIGAGHISRTYYLRPDLTLPQLPQLKLASLPHPIVERKQ
jgi:hypothetical protein